MGNFWASALLISGSLALAGCANSQGNPQATLRLTEYECNQGLSWACRMLPAVREAAGLQPTEQVAQASGSDDNETPQCTYGAFGHSCNAAGDRVNTQAGQTYTPPRQPEQNPQYPAADNDETPRCTYSAFGRSCNAAGDQVNARAGHAYPPVPGDDVPRSEPPVTTEATGRRPYEATLHRDSGTLVVPVLINDRLTLDFVVDSGASLVTIPADVVLTLKRTGTLQQEDFVGTQTFGLANGATTESETFIIRKLTVGGHEVRNVRASITPVAGSLLLGQSFLGRFRSWLIDNRRQVLVLN